MLIRKKSTVLNKCKSDHAVISPKVSHLSRTKTSTSGGWSTESLRIKHFRTRCLGNMSVCIELQEKGLFTGPWANCRRLSTVLILESSSCCPAMHTHFCFTADDGFMTLKISQLERGISLLRSYPGFLCDQESRLASLLVDHSWGG